MVLELLLTNSGYLENQTRYYYELLESQDLSDVTLACDGYEVGAHKTIVSASSLFFREVIRKSKHPNPYIYLKGVNKETLEAILKFIYNGEVTARSSNLENLVDVANELQIEGLMVENSKTNEKTTFSRNRIENLLGLPLFYKVADRQTDRANTRGPGGPKNQYCVTF